MDGIVIIYKIILYKRNPKLNTIKRCSVSQSDMRSTYRTNPYSMP